MCVVIERRFLGIGPYEALAVANALLAALPEGWSDVAPQRVHDLVYMVDGWSSVIDERRFVREDPRPVMLGDTGPRYLSIEAAFGGGRLRRERFTEGLLGRPARARMTPDEIELVARVAGRYGAHDRRALAAMHLHPETPFARSMLGDGRYDEGAVRRHFERLARAARTPAHAA